MIKFNELNLIIIYNYKKLLNFIIILKFNMSDSVSRLKNRIAYD